jgi:hypothetical protein
MIDPRYLSLVRCVTLLQRRGDVACNAAGYIEKIRISDADALLRSIAFASARARRTQKFPRF